MAAEEPEPPVRGETPGYRCSDEGLDSFVGRQASQEVGSELLRLSGARTLRWLPKGTITTMEYRADRLKVWLAADNKIERVNCG
jgi:hypothetical protein